MAGPANGRRNKAPCHSKALAKPQQARRPQGANRLVNRTFSQGVAGISQLALRARTPKALDWAWLPR